MKSSQFQLLSQRRFAPFYAVLIAGAMNDNVFKFAFIVLVTYRLQLDWLPPAQANVVIGGLFMLPFFFLSATAGQLADKLSKHVLVRYVKSLELLVVCIGAWGLLTHNPYVLLLTTFCMGAQSALFGPVKYSYLPAVLHKEELVGGNAMVEGGTFLAILLGQVVGGYLMDLPKEEALRAEWAVVLTCVGLAVLGRVAAQFVPAMQAADPTLRVRWNPLVQTWRAMQQPWPYTVVFRAILGVSWLLFVGAFCITVFPVFAKDVLYGEPDVVLLLLVAFSVGIAIGSALCGKLAVRHVADDSAQSAIKTQWVFVGAAVVSIFAIDLGVASADLPQYTALRDAGAVLDQSSNWRILVDLLLMSVGAGLYSVPLYALVQERSPKDRIARMIAAGNIYDALFVLASAVSVAALLATGLSLPSLFIVLGVANAVFVALVLFPVLRPSRQS